MFIFLGCIIITGIIVGLGIASDAGASGLGYSSTSTTSTTTATSETITKEKKNLSPNGESIIGLRNPSLVVTSQTGTPTTTTFDTTTYGDRAVLKLTNNTGSSLTLTGISIRGKIVSQLAGANGYVWEYSDYDAIEKEGESFVEISNDFIFSPSQAKSIGDFAWKELKPHKLYALGLLGTHYEYEIGDVYHLTLNHTMNGGVMEDIDTDVEVMGVTIDRTVGSVGSTLLNLRVPSAAWALTLSKNAKLVGAGNSQRLNNRSNIVTVASSTWTGQADYFCDGTDDNVEIQAAIDFVYSLGGGEIILTSGSFYTSYIIRIWSNMILSGYGKNTIIYGACTVSHDLFFYEADDSSIRDLVIDGSLVDKGFGAVGTYNSSRCEAYNIEVRNYISTSNPGYIWALAVDGIISNCYVHNISTSIIDMFAVGIHGSDRVQYNIVDNITATGGGITGFGYGYAVCYKCQQNIASNTSHSKYYQCYSTSTAIVANACADTADGGFNS